MIVIVDNGSQYTHVIWRSVRDLDHDGKIVPNTVPYAEIADAEKFILSGGPGSAFSDDVGVCKDIVQRAVNESSAPVLGICLGHQIIAHYLGGRVDKGANAEYGLMQIEVDIPDLLFDFVPKKFNAWVSHFDEVKEIPPQFISLAHSAVCKCEAMKHEERNIFGLQFHPEVWHTENGEQILKNFLEIK